MNFKNDLSKIKDNQLLDNFSHVVRQERESIALVVAHLAEIDKRKLYAREGYSSLFSYCVKKFHYSEQAIYRRIQAARLSQHFPEILALLDSGAIHFTALTLISPYVKQENKEILFQGVQRKSKQEIETFLASHFPMTKNIPDKITRLSHSKNSVLALEKVPSEILSLFDQKQEDAQKITIASDSSPLNAELNQGSQSGMKRRIKIEFSADEQLAEKIKRVKEVMRHTYPHGRLEDIFNELLEFYLEKKAPERKIARMEKAAVGKEEKSAAPKRNQKEERSAGSIQSRYIPQEIRRKVWKRDRGECSYQAPDGKKCAERGALEIDHIHPFALGGDSTTQNLQLLCRTHNHYRAQQTFGVFRV